MEKIESIRAHFYMIVCLFFLFLFCAATAPERANFSASATDSIVASVCSASQITRKSDSDILIFIASELPLHPFSVFPSPHLPYLCITKLHTRIFGQKISLETRPFQISCASSNARILFSYFIPPFSPFFTISSISSSNPSNPSISI